MRATAAPGERPSPANAQACHSETPPVARKARTLTSRTESTTSKALMLSKNKPDAPWQSEQGVPQKVSAGLLVFPHESSRRKQPRPTAHTHGGCLALSPSCARVRRRAGPIRQSRAGLSAKLRQGAPGAPGRPERARGCLGAQLRAAVVEAAAAAAAFHRPDRHRLGPEQVGRAAAARPGALPAALRPARFVGLSAAGTCCA